MQLLDQRIIGAAILLLSGVLAVVKRAATGSIVERPGGPWAVRLVNIYNLIFLLGVMPIVAVAMMSGRLAAIDYFQMTIQSSWIAAAAETAGLAACVTGYLLMTWALISLGRNYQLGGIPPRSGDRMVSGGPYKLIRHPMYTAALSISLGVAFLVRSWAFLGAFGVYLVLILLLIPVEENGLRAAYGERYAARRQRARRLIPFVY